MILCLQLPNVESRNFDSTLRCKGGKLIEEEAQRSLGKEAVNPRVSKASISFVFYFCYVHLRWIIRFLYIYFPRDSVKKLRSDLVNDLVTDLANDLVL